MQDLIYNVNNLQLLLLQVKKSLRNCEFVLFKESNLRRKGGCFSDKTVCVSPNMLLISSF